MNATAVMKTIQLGLLIRVIQMIYPIHVIYLIYPIRAIQTGQEPQQVSLAPQQQTRPLA